MKSIRLIVGPVTVTLLAWLAAGIQAAEDNAESDDRRFRAEDIFELEYAADPRISPDGRQVVYVRNSLDIMKDATRSNLWIIDSDGSDHRPLMSGRKNYSSPRWSPDGKRLAFVSGAEGKPQLYVRWMDSGQTALLTNLQQAPSAVSWSPDGRSLAFVMQVPANRAPLAKPPEKPEGAKWAPPVKLVDRLVYRIDGQGMTELAWRHIFIVPAEGGTPRQLTEGDFHHSGPLSWTPDGKHIVFSANRSEDWEYEPTESDLYRIAMADGTLEQLTTRKGPDSNPVVSPNGRYIAYNGFDDREVGYQHTHLYVMDSEAKTTRNLSVSLDRSVQNLNWAGNNRVMYQYDDHGVTKLAGVSLSGSHRVFADRLGGTSLGRPYTSGSYTVSDKGSFAFTVNSPQRPADVAAGTGRQTRQLTHLNEDLLAHRDLASVEAMTWPSSFDGREIQGWVALPPGFDPAQRYPLILEIHGGPYAAYGPNFSAEIQRYAAEGYVVLYANPRGSTSYGEEFAGLINHAYPGNDYDDLMSGVDALLKENYIDQDNLFVTGGSGGGVLTAWIVGRTDRFNAAVVAKPVINMTSFALTADFVNYFYKYWFTAYPWEAPQEYWRRSPLSLVGNVKTPTMLLTGESDLRTPISESEQFYVALKLQKVDTALLRIPGAPHGIAGRPSNMIAKVDNILGWFKKYRSDRQDGGKD